MFCPSCGKNLPDNAMFCDGCGTNLSQGTVSVAQNKAAKGSINIIYAIVALVTLIGSFLPFYNASDNFGLGISQSVTLFDMGKETDGITTFLAIVLIVFGVIYILTGLLGKKGLYITSLVLSVLGIIVSIFLLAVLFAANDRNQYSELASMSMGIGFYMSAIGTVLTFILSIVGLSKNK